MMVKISIIEKDWTFKFNGSFFLLVLFILRCCVLLGNFASTIMKIIFIAFVKTTHPIGLTMFPELMTASHPGRF
jgi:hypothetical protein